MPAKPDIPKKPRSEFIGLRLTPVEREAIETAIMLEGVDMSISDYIRQVVMQRIDEDLDEDELPEGFHHSTAIMQISSSDG